ncbi:MAG: glycosyltransferase family 9 protein [Proteobacteria bacterium]|nr:glycosyltransferase family 9 protein [Pseudomonadota bacterium]
MVTRNILFIGLSSVGDAVMTTPVLQSLHALYPDALFDIVTDRRSVSLYENCPYKRQLYLKDKDKFLRGVPDLIFKLWSTRYDIIVDLRTDGLAYLLRGKNKYTKWKSRPYGEHAVEELMGVIASLHASRPIPETKVWLSDRDRNYADQKLNSFKDKQKLLALSVGDPNKPVKTLNVERFIKLLERHESDFSGVVFLGGGAEHENTRRVASKIKMPYVNATGNSLMEAAALLERTRLYIGPDSGLGHIASAVRTPTISFFSQVGPERFRPWGVPSICFRGEQNDARNINFDDISNAIRTFLNE